MEHVETSDTVGRWTHMRLVALMMVLLGTDLVVLGACTYLCLQNGPSVLILFGFEYAILAVTVTATLIRYGLHMIDMRIDGTWQSKGSYVFFLEFMTEMLRFVFYLIFFTIIFTYYGMPLHIVRELWVSYQNLRRRLTAYQRYRKLVANMNQRFPDATEEELEACEHICIICRDHMDGGKKLPCGHIFHAQCLRTWLQHQQTCPTCRDEIPVDGPVRPRGHVPGQQPAQAPAQAGAAAAAAAGNNAPANNGPVGAPAAGGAAFGQMQGDQPPGGMGGGFAVPPLTPQPSLEEKFADELEEKGDTAAVSYPPLSPAAQFPSGAWSSTPRPPMNPNGAAAAAEPGSGGGGFGGLPSSTRVRQFLPCCTHVLVPLARSAVLTSFCLG